MKETTEQYVKRILGYVKGEDPLKIQKRTANRLARLIKPLSRKEMRRRPAPDKWSIAEILAHLADVEIVASWRIRLILANNGTPIQGFDQDAWAKTFDYAGVSPKQSLKVFRVLRENNLCLLASVSPQLWKNHGMHSERGRETIAHLVRLFAGHDLNHLQQIEELATAKREK